MNNFRPSTRGGYNSRKDDRFSSRDKRQSRFSSGSQRRSSDGDRRPVTMYQAICDQCQSKCEVPFRPTGLEF